VEFVLDHASNAILARELAASPSPMLMGADCKIVRNAQVRSAVSATRHDIDGIAITGLHAPRSMLWIPASAEMT
jgi:hypothetical protein